MSSIEGPAAARRPVRKERPAPVTRTVTRYDAAGTELGQVTLEASIFGIEPNVAVLHQVVTAQLAAARSGTHSTKTRAETRGGGAKPFRQKGMGRSRQGSLRAPQYSGGGVALGPKPRSYRQHTPKKMVKLALASALSDRAADGRIVLVDHWPWERPRTKDAVAALEALDLGGRVLAVLSRDDAVADRSFSNLKEVDTILQAELSAYDVLRSDWVVFTDATLPGGGAEVPTGPATTETAATEDTTVEAGEPPSPETPAGETPVEESSVAEETPVAEEGEDA